jgi:hypothetical protein
MTSGLSFRGRVVTGLGLCAFRWFSGEYELFESEFGSTGGFDSSVIRLVPDSLDFLVVVADRFVSTAFEPEIGFSAEAALCLSCVFDDGTVQTE